MKQERQNNPNWRKTKSGWKEVPKEEQNKSKKKSK